MAEQKTEAKKESIIIRKETPEERIIRIMQTDVPANKSVYAGLTRIKGISWSISNLVCGILKLNRNTKISALSKEEIQKIEETLKEHKFPTFMLNRRNDYTTGESSHLVGSNLDLAKELDIKRLKKIRSWRGWRHATGQPTRGQSTKSHFRHNRKKGVGLKTKKAAPTKTFEKPAK